MTNNARPSVFARAMSVNPGKYSFIITIAGMIGCFLIPLFVKDTSRMTTYMMICGIGSAVACQQFCRVITAIRWQDANENKE